jgi:hypothetical protein
VFYVLTRARAQESGQQTFAGTGADMVFSFALRFPAFKPKSAKNRLVPAEHVVSTVHGTRTVLLDARSGHYYGLDEVGSRIWSLTNDGLTPDAIAQKLTEEYDAPIDALQRDVTDFVTHLRKSRLLVDA